MAKTTPAGSAVLVGGALLGGAAAMVYQFAIVSALIFILGDSVTLFAVFSGLFLCAMGLGCWAASRVTANRAAWFVRSQFFLSCGGFLSLPLLFLLHALLARQGEGSSWAVSGALWTAGLAMDAALGFLAGLQLPLLAALSDELELSRPLSALLGYDYLGSFLGALAFPLLLFPRLGLFRTAFVAALVDAFVAVTAAAALGGRPRRFDGGGPAAWALAALIAGAIAQTPALEAFIDGLVYGR